MNQRASHFQLGSTSQNYASVYGKDYPHKVPDPNQIQVNNPFRGSSLKHDERGSFATTNKTLLRAWDNAEIARLDDEKLRQLKTHHFKLGSYSPNEAMTTNKIYHDKKLLSGQASKYQEESKNKMRGHNHNFKEQSFTNYKSAYANQFTPKQAQTVGAVNNSHSEQAICFGNHALPMVTTNGVSFTPKEAARVRAKPEPSSGVKFGDRSEPMETINQLYYNQKEITKASLPESTMNELRNTHFNLGQAQLQYQTESNNYRSIPTRSQQNSLTYKIPTYESGTWNSKDAKFNATTTNQRELPNREVKPFERAVQAARNGIEFGGHAGQYTSQFKGKYGAPSNVTPNSLQVNKKSNVVIGSSNVHNYTTENKASFRPKDLLEGRCNVDIKKLSSEDHFHIGGTTVEPKVTVYQDEHRPEVDKRNRTFHKENK